MTTANQLDNTNPTATAAAAQRLKPKYAMLYRRASHLYRDVQNLQRPISRDESLKCKAVVPPVLKSLEVMLLEHYASLFRPGPATIPDLPTDLRAVANARLGLQLKAAE